MFYLQSVSFKCPWSQEILNRSHFSFPYPCYLSILPNYLLHDLHRSHRYCDLLILRRKTKLAAAAKKHIKTVQELLGAVNESLAKIAAEHVPSTDAAKQTNGNKRKVSEDATAGTSAKKKKKKLNPSPNKNSELAAREDRAMEQLVAFVEERKASPKIIDGFRSRVTRKGTRYDVNFFNEAGRRFRSMMEVGRFLNIVKNEAVGAKAKVQRRKGGSSRDQEAEKKRIRKELEKLRKAHQRATKALDDYSTANNESRYPMDDRILIEEQAAAAATNGDNKGGSSALVKVTPTTCAAARIPDMTGFPGIPLHCTPEVLMTWDFLCTFDRALSLAPIALDDFASALVYVPPDGQMGDDVLVPPVYLAEAHLGLLKLLFQDKSSDEWWWSVLETEETEGIKVDGLEETGGKDDVDRPVIKINIAAALAEVEDPLITSSWLRSLEKVTDGAVKKEAINSAIRAALKLVTNKWIAAYLRKSLDVCKVSGAALTQQAVRWLVRRVRDARPDLGERATRRLAKRWKASLVPLRPWGTMMLSRTLSTTRTKATTSRTTTKMIRTGVRTVSKTLSMSPNDQRPHYPRNLYQLW
jgi:DDT domain